MTSPNLLILYVENALESARFYKMIFAVRKRFDKEAQPLTQDSASPPSTTLSASENGNGATNQ